MKRNYFLQRCRAMGGPTGRLLVVAAGILVGQAILYGPSLVGWKILLPLDHLAVSNVYIPRSPETEKIVPHNFIRSDLIFVFEPLRWYTAEEMAAGRSASWTPFQYAGTPMMFGKYSPMWVLRSCSTSPVIIAWMQLFISLIIGFGAYLFCRHVLQVGFWPATIAAWCYPMTGFFVFWEGFPLAWVAGWLPWLLLAIDKTVRQPGSWGGLGVVLVTYLIVADRQLDISGQVLLASGLFALWRLFDEFGREWLAQHSTKPKTVRGKSPPPPPPVSIWQIGRQPLKSALAITCAWGLGFLLAAPCLLPTLEYSQTGFRMRQRGSGDEERPPVGLEALPQTVLPDMYGSTQDGSFPIFPAGQGNQLESSSATYTGLLGTLLVAPLAWCSRRHRSINVFWFFLGFFGLSWCLDVPGVVDLLRTPGLNMMSHNRLVFATSFAILAMMAVGLDVLWQGDVRWRLWFWGPIGLLALLLLWCAYRTVVLPEPIAHQFGSGLVRGDLPMDFLRQAAVMGITDLAAVQRVQTTFMHYYAAAAVLCILGIAGWSILGLRPKWRPRLLPGLAVLLLADMLWFAYGRSAQCDPSLYYPRIPALEEVAKATPGRIIGFGCFPALLNHVCRLGDIRGDDGVEPARLIDLAKIAEAPNSPKNSYALTQWLVPKLGISRSGAVRISPLLDMLNVRYVIFRGNPPPGLKPDFSSPDYWVLTNRRALPRVFVPEHVETVIDDKERLKKLASEDFDPRRVAYVERDIPLPDQCSGTAEIVEEIPTKISVSMNMQTAGLVVLADLWDQGWNAYLNGEKVPILRTNHAIRGVEVPAGKGTIEFRYEPASLARGLLLRGLALLAMIGWGGAIAWNSYRGKRMGRNML